MTQRFVGGASDKCESSMFRGLLLFLTYGILKSNASCSNSTGVVGCSSFEDLKTTECPEQLMISDQRSFKLNRSHLDGCEKTTYIDIRECLTGVDADSFAGMDALTHLSFSNDMLPRINANWFPTNSRITYLSITNSNVIDIDLHAFQNLNNLGKLIINRNNLTIIERDVFYELSISSLTLSRNEIYELEYGAFEKLTSLKQLRLDHNNLTAFVANEALLESTDKLEILWLHYNLFTQLNSLMLRGLGKLKILNVSYNKISTIEPSCFEHTPDLEFLLLKDNRLTDFPSTIFPDAGLNRLTKLYIDNNRLTYLKSNVLHKLRKLKSIVLGGNPWQCKCLDHILRWLVENKIRNECDKDYMDGKRPICVVGIRRSNECVYQDNSYFYSKYSAEIQLYPPLPVCL